MRLNSTKRRAPSLAGVRGRIELLEARRLLACDRIDGGAPLEVPSLSSDAAAYKKLYLDFDGDIFRRWGSWAGIGGTDTRGPVPAYDIDGDVTCFSQAELQNIRDIYSIVKEKFSPFEIDVTTIDPGSLDDGRAGKVVIGGDGMWYSSTAGGVAARDGFYGHGESVAYVWDAPQNVRYVGETIAHEAGHFLGLKHQSLYAPDARLVDEYRRRFIMGSGDLDTPGGRWGVGTSTGRDSFDGSIDRDSALQDDVATLVAKGLAIRADDHGDSRAAASTMALSDFGFAASGVLERESDVDFFRISGVTPGTLVTFAVRGNSLAPMLDARLEVYDAVGTLVAAAENADVYDEAIVVASSVSSTYYVAVRAATNPADEYNVGQYQLDVGLGAFADDTPAGATLLTGIEEFDAASPQVVGRQLVSGFVSNADRWDWYAFEAPRDAEAFIALTGLSANAHLYAFRQGDSGRPARLLFASTNGGSLSESGWVTSEHTRSWLQNRILVGVQYVSGGGTGYVLNVTVDSPTQTFEIYALRRGDATGTDYYGYVGPGDVDQVVASSAWDAHFSTTYAAHATLVTYSGTARLNLGYDLNGDRQLDAAEVLETHVASPGADATASNLPLVDVAGRPLRFVVENFASSTTNYRLRLRPEVYRPTLDVDLRDLGLAGLDLGLTRHELRLADVLDDEAPYSAIALPPPPAGTIELSVAALDQALADYALVRDANENGVVDQGEIVASGKGMKFSVPNGDAAPYYFVAALSPQSNLRTAAFALTYRDAIALANAGTDPKAPLELPLNSQIPTSGFVVSDPGESLHRPVTYYRVVVDKPGQLGLDLAFGPPATLGEAGSRELQLIVGQDRNQDGLIDASERILTRTKGDEDSLSLDVVVQPGVYLATIELVAGEAATEAPVGIDYALQTRFGPPLDTTSVEIKSAQTRHFDGAVAVQLAFSEDVRASLASGEIALRTAEAPFRLVEPLVQQYDEQTQTLLLILDPRETERAYTVEIAAGAIADPWGNFLAKPFAFTFRPGDFNDDGEVDGADLADPQQGWEIRWGGDLNGRDWLLWQRNFAPAAADYFAALAPSPEATDVAHTEQTPRTGALLLAGTEIDGGNPTKAPSARVAQRPSALTQRQWNAAAEPTSAVAVADAVASASAQAATPAATSVVRAPTRPQSPLESRSVSEGLRRGFSVPWKPEA